MDLQEIRLEDVVRELELRGAMSWLLQFHSNSLGHLTRQGMVSALSFLGFRVLDPGGLSMDELVIELLKRYDEKVILSRLPKSVTAPQTEIPGFWTHTFELNVPQALDILTYRDLDDLVLDAGLLSLTLHQEQQMTPSRPKILLLDTHFLTSLMGLVIDGPPPHGLRVEGAQDLLRRYHLTPSMWSQNHLIFIPAHYASHWTAFLLYRSPGGSKSHYGVLHLNSLGPRTRPSRKAQEIYFMALLPFLQILGINVRNQNQNALSVFPVVAPVPQQRDTINCGCYVLHFAIQLIRSREQGTLRSGHMSRLLKPEFWNSSSLGSPPFNPAQVRRAFLRWISDRYEIPLSAFLLDT